MSSGTKKKKQPPRSKIDGLPYHSDICDFAAENAQRKRDFKAGKSDDTNFLEDLKPIDVLLLHTLRAGMNSKNKKNWRNLETLAEEMGTWSSSIERSVARLEEMNLITVAKRGKKGGGYQGNEYRIIYPWEPVPLKTRESESLKTRETNSLKMRETLPSKQGKLIPSKQGANTSSTRSTNKSIKKNKLKSTFMTDEDASTTLKKHPMVNEAEPRDLKYGFELQDEYSRGMNIFDWYEYMCRKNKNLKPEVEKYIKNKGSGAIRDPAAFHTHILKRLRSGEEESFWYTSPQEIAEEVRLNRERAEASHAYYVEQRRQSKIRSEKYVKAQKLFEALPHEDMEEMGLSMDNFGKNKQREDFLISMIPEMKKILSVDQGETISE